MTKGTRVLATLLAVVFALAAASPVYASGGNRKCNSGNGNGSESTVLNDCDPGNSGGHNNGGD
jgi:hypothetical protein